MIFNESPYNVGLYDGPPNVIVSASVSGDLIVFDGFSLSDNSTVFTQQLLDSAPSRQIIDGAVPRGDGMYMNGEYWRQKVIEVEGFCKESTSTLLETLLDTVRKNLAGREKNLDITRNGTTRRYVATLTNPEDLFSDRQGHHITVCPFRAQFVCKEPFGLESDYTSATEQAVISPLNITMENLGTIDAKPVLVLIFDAASSVTTVNVENTTNGEEIEYSDAIAANDVLEFDSEKKTVKKNGTEVDYSGAFPTLIAGSNVMQFTITGTSFDAQITVKHKNTYL